MRRVGRLDAGDVLDVLEPRTRRVVHVALEVELHRLGVEVRAVLELDATAQGEDVDVGLRVLGLLDQVADDLALLVDLEQRVDDIASTMPLNTSWTWSGRTWSRRAAMATTIWPPLTGLPGAGGWPAAVGRLGGRGRRGGSRCWSGRGARGRFGGFGWLGRRWRSRRRTGRRRRAAGGDKQAQRGRERKDERESLWASQAPP